MSEVVSIRCPKDNDGDQLGRHYRIDIHMPLLMEKMGKIIKRNSKCCCGEQMILPGVKGFTVENR